MRGWIRALLALSMVVVLAAWLAMPVLTVRALVRAAETGDEATLERLVDFPAFRESAKVELTGRLMREMREDQGGGGGSLGGLGLMLAPMLVGGAVDALVNAPTVAAMVRTADVPDAVDPDPVAAPEQDTGGEIRQGYGYRDLNTFVLTLTDPDRPDEPLKLLLKRQGLFGWRLAGIDLAEA
jgi:hypothetical protein